MCQQVEKCFDQLKGRRRINEITQIINRYQQILPPELPPLQKFTQTRTSHTYNNTNSFVPSPDLIKSYQQTFSKANQNQRILATTNYKLKANFSQPTHKHNILKNQTLRLDRDQAILIEGREETILRQLHQGHIQTTIPQMENSLFINELSSLQHKNVTIENTLSIDEWKKLRQKINPQRLK